MAPVEPEAYVPPAPARLRTDVFLTFGGKVIVLGLGFALVAVVARELGTSDTGSFLVAYSLTILLSQIGGLGLTTANPYFAAREPSRIPQIVANSLWLAAGLGTVLALAGASIKVIFPGALEGLGWAPLIVTLIGLPGGLAAFLLQSVLLGEGRMVAYNGIEASQTALTLVAVVAGFVFFDFGLTGTLARHRRQPLRGCRGLSVPAPSTLIRAGKVQPRRLRGGCSPMGSAPMSRSSSPT